MKIIFKIGMIVSLIFNPAKSQNKSIILFPEEGKMHCNIIKSLPKKQRWALTMPETIGCEEEGMLLNFPGLPIHWETNNDSQTVASSYTIPEKISYSLLVLAHEDFVDAEMTIKNLTKNTWHNVWSFNCLSPSGAEDYQDTLLERTYMSSGNKPILLSKTTRKIGPRPTIGVYYSDKVAADKEYPFVEDFEATSPIRTDDSYLIAFSKDGNYYMAATSPQALFLFDNLEYKCIHSAPLFGDIQPQQSVTVTCRFYFSKGSVEDFVERFKKDKKANFNN